MAVTDDFNRANGALGANWTTNVSFFFACTIVSNTCKGGTGSQHNVSYYSTGGTVAADQYGQVKIATTGGFMGPVLRYDGVTTFYTCYYNAGPATIYKWDGGGAHQIGTGSTITPAINDVVYFEAVGSTLTFKVNGTTVCTATDSSITGAGYTGIDIYDTVGALDDFEAGAVTANVSVNLTGVAASPAIGTGTVTTDTAPTVSVNLTGVAASPVIGIGTVTGVAVVTPPDQGLVTGGPPHWYGILKDEKVYLVGVAANPQVGTITPMARGTLEELEKMYPFPRRVTRLVPRRKTKPTAFVYMLGVHPVPKIGSVTTKMFYEDDDEELSSILRMMDVDEEVISALKLAK